MNVPKRVAKVVLSNLYTVTTELDGLCHNGLEHLSKEDSDFLAYLSSFFTQIREQMHVFTLKFLALKNWVFPA